MAKIYFQNGIIKEINPNNGTDFTLGELQTIVGGYVEIVTLPNDQLMVVDEEGKIKQKKINVRATQLIAATIHNGDIIVGDALVCDSSQIK